MVYHTQNYWVFGLFLSFGILGTRKHDVSETGSVPLLRCVCVREGGKTPTQLGPLDRATSIICGPIPCKESTHMACLTSPISQPSLDISPIWIPLIGSEVYNSQRRYV
jgi:hypothetical protein